MKDGFVLSACAVPEIRVADPAHNAGEAIGLIADASERGVKLLVFPALCLTGATAGDLFRQPALLTHAQGALKKIAACTADKRMLVLIGLPFAHRGKLYNCAAALSGGRVLGLSAAYGEGLDLRYFAPAPEHPLTVSLFGADVPLGKDLVFTAAELPSFSVSAAFSADTRQDGANIVAVLGADSEGVGRAQYRRTCLLAASGQQAAGIVYAGAGAGESTTDLVFSGHSLIAENGVILAESELFTSGLTALCEIDTAFVERERSRRTPGAERTGIVIEFSCPLSDAPLSRTFARTPFVPGDKAECRARAALILEIQAQGLYRRVRHTKSKSLVIGVSGGLDSTLALLVCVRAAKLLGKGPDRIGAYTMPCFGTGKRTRQNAEALCKALGVPLESIDITAAVRAHFKDIGQSETVHDTAYENAQARMRTMVLMDKANQLGGLVIGTGDLSEAALGFSTYNGDHMSMYNVNASVPKTLIRELIKYEAGRLKNKALQAVLDDIIDTPVSPELLPAKADAIAQQTESIVGPYVLHDFFLYHTVRRGATPKTLFRIALHAFSDTVPAAELHQWLTVFYKRFFSQQFKRSCAPDGPKTGSVSLSPRGDWRMPSDASAALWLKETEELLTE